MIRVTKSEMQELKRKIPDLYFSHTKHNNYAEERPAAKKALNVIRNSSIRCWKRARITACIMALLLLIVMLAGCRQAGKVVYTDTVLSVTMQGTTTTITDKLTGEDYHFTTRRMRTAQTVQEASQRARCKTTTDTDTLTIMTALDVIFVVEKSSGQHIIIKAK